MLQKIKSNWKSGCTIALVSLPLSISLAVASQVSPIQGIITAIWAGLVASIFGGSNYNIIGPTGALSGLIATFVLTQGLGSLAGLTIIVGGLILIAYSLHFEKYLIFIPSSVMHGFMLGVACIIGLSQLNFALGLKNLPIHTEFIRNLWESLAHLTHISGITFLIFLNFLVALILLRKWLPQIPGTIILSPLGIFIGYYFSSSLGLETLGSRYGVITGQLFQLPIICFSRQLFWPAGIIALVAILETMLSAKIADSITKTKHHSNREILGLGLANLASGLTGGIPATAALARTVLNIKAGATDKLSATISSLVIALFSVLLLPFFHSMPMVVIAAILINLAINMVEMEHFERLFKYDKINFVISILVALVTIYKDAVIGILGGAAISLLLFVEKLSHGYYELNIASQIANIATTPITASQPIQTQHLSKSTTTEILIYKFKGKLSYLNTQGHILRFENELQKYAQIILCFREIYFIDLDGADAISEIIATAHQRSQTVLITELNPLAEQLLKTASAPFRQLEKQNLIFPNTQAALTYLKAK